MVRILVTTLAFLTYDAILYFAATPTLDSAELLQGSWEVVSVERSGENDPWQVGAILIFAGDEVRLESQLLLVHNDADLDPLQAGPPGKGGLAQGAAAQILDGTS